MFTGSSTHTSMLILLYEIVSKTRLILLFILLYCTIGEEQKAFNTHYTMPLSLQTCLFIFHFLCLNTVVLIFPTKDGAAAAAAAERSAAATSSSLSSASSSELHMYYD